MILAIGFMSVVGLSPASCLCHQSPLFEEKVEVCASRQSRPIAPNRQFREIGWRAPVAYGPGDAIPLLHLPASDLGSSTGWSSARGRRGQWQIDAWQIISISPLWVGRDAHVHLRYRLPRMHREGRSRWGRFKRP